jgi:antirestriction protein
MRTITQEERIANTIAELGYEVQAYTIEDTVKIGYLIDNCFYDSVKEMLDDSYLLDDTTLYEVETLTELAELFIDEGLFGKIPENLINYIDYESIGRDLQYDYDEYIFDGTTYFMRKD